MTAVSAGVPNPALGELDDPGGDEPNRVAIARDLRAPLRDGVELAVTLYRPAGPDRPRPVIVAMTPYLADSEHRRGMYFAARGFGFAVADVRGRGNSAGAFQPFHQEAADAPDLLAWIARQPFCDGRIAMWGGSYAGHAQWLGAAARPAGLATIVPAAAPFIGLDFPMRNHICEPFMVRWLALLAGRSLQAQLFADDAYWAEACRDWLASGEPFRSFDARAGCPSPIFQQWLNEQDTPAYWRGHNPSDQDYAAIDLPVLTITGVYDDNQPGAIAHYRHHLRARAGGPERHYLVIGPWDHAGTRDPEAYVGGVRFGPHSLLDLGRLHVEWYRWALGERPSPPTFLHDRVSYYMAGAEHWRWSPTLEAVTGSHQRLYLDSDGNRATRGAPGRLTDEPPTGAPDQYLWDPVAIGAAAIEAEAGARPGLLTDPALFEALGARQLVYETPPFAADTELAGFFALAVWLAIDAPDTDLYASIHLIGGNDGCLRLTHDALRARYRDGVERPALLGDRQPQRYQFDKFTFVARRLARGERLRVVIAPMGRLTDGRFAERNLNGGGVVCDEPAAAARAVTVTLFHDADHLSLVRVPIANPCQAAPNAGDADWFTPVPPKLTERGF